MPPEVAKASTSISLLQVIVTSTIALTFANVNTALINILSVFYLRPRKQKEAKPLLPPRSLTSQMWNFLKNENTLFTFSLSSEGRNSNYLS